MNRVACTRGAVLLALVSALASGCSQSPGAPERPAGPVRLGLLAPTAGDASTGTATPAEEGARLAVDLVNERHDNIPLPLARTSGLPGLDGAQVALSVGSSTDDGRQADQQVADLVENEHAAALVAFGDTAELTAASQRTEQREVPFVAAGSGQGVLTERGLEWFFRISPTDADYTDSFLNVLARQRDATGRTRLAVVYPADQEGAATAYDVVDTAKQRGQDAVPVPVPAGQSTQATAVAAAMRAGAQANVDGIVLVAGDTQTAQAEATAAAGVPGTFLDVDPALQVTDSVGTPVLGLGAGFEDAAGLSDLTPRFPGLLAGSAWSSETVGWGRVGHSLGTLYSERFGRPMTREAAEAFTATYAVLRAIDTAASTDPGTVRAALLAMRLPGRELLLPWDGVSFDETHQNVSARGALHQLADSGHTLVEPADLTGAAAPLASADNPSGSDPSPGSG